MPDESAGVIAPSPGATSDPATATAAGAIDPTQAGGPGPVPYDRFKQVNDKANQEAGLRAQIEAQARTLQEQNRNLLNVIAQQRHQPAPHAQPSPEQTPEEAALEQQIAAYLGDDPQGQNARKVIDATVRLAEIRARKGQPTNAGGGVTPEQVQQMVAQQVGMVTATMSTNSTLDNWVASGIIRPEQKTELLGQMQAGISSNPGWGTAENQPLLLNNLLAQGITSGTIKPGTAPAIPRPGGSPLQPGGSGGGVNEDQQFTDMAAEMKRRFPSLANRDEKVLAERLKAQGLPSTTGNFARRA